MPIVTMPDGVNVQFPDEMPKEQIRGLILQKFPDAAKAAPNGSAIPQMQAPINRRTRMIEVELPDGSIAEFPDGTDPAVIKGALQKKFGASSQMTDPSLQNGNAADIAQLERALRNADAAGDADAARRFASEITKMRTAPVQNGNTAPQTQAPVNDGTVGPTIARGGTSLMQDRINQKSQNGTDSQFGSAGLGAADTASFGFGDELGAGLGAVSEYLASKVTGSEPRSYDELLTTMRKQNETAQEKNPGSYLAGQAAGAIGTGAGLARGGLSLTANAIGRGATLPRIAGASALEGGLFGGAQGFGGGEGIEDRLKKTGYGAGTGAVIGGALPFATSGLSSVMRRAVSPMRITPERQAMVDTLRNEGVELTAGQTTGNKTLAYMESELGGGRGADFLERQGEQFTAAALRRAGIDANRATPEIMDQGFTQLGQQFDDLAARNAVIPDRQMLNDIRATLRGYRELVPETARAPAVDGLTRDIVVAAQNPGGISGEAYQALRSRLDSLARGSGSDPYLANAFRGLRDTVDDAMERSLRATNPADLGAWRTVRNQYRNMLILEKAATGAGENAAGGLISPSQLRNAVVGMGRRAYARGQGDLSQLARAGERLMKALPNSGTAPRTAARNIGMSIPSLLGAGAGASGGPMGAIAGGIAGAAVPFAAGRALLSGPGRAYLSNQVAANPILNPAQGGLLQSMLNQLGAGVSSGRIAP